MIDELLKFFVLFFVIVEPVSLVPLFAALTEGADEDFRRRMALKAVLLAATMFLLFAVGGAWFLRVMGISIEAFRIAGGIMLFLIALEMVFARESGTRQTTKERVEAKKRADISVFPLAFPFIAGPGALAIVLLTFGASRGDLTLVRGTVRRRAGRSRDDLPPDAPDAARHAGHGRDRRECRQPALWRRACGARGAVHHHGREHGFRRN